MNPLASTAAGLLALVLALLLCLWAVLAVAVLTAGRFVVAAIGAVGEGVRELIWFSR